MYYLLIGFVIGFIIGFIINLSRVVKKEISKCTYSSDPYSDENIDKTIGNAI